MVWYSSVVSWLQIIAVSGLVDDPGNNALADFGAQAFVLRHVCKPAGFHHEDVFRLIA
jgi:hypothetical protein